jgi:hypothetical protein
MMSENKKVKEYERRITPLERLFTRSLQSQFQPTSHRPGFPLHFRSGVLRTRGAISKDRLR